MLKGRGVPGAHPDAPRFCRSSYQQWRSKWVLDRFALISWSFLLVPGLGGAPLFTFWWPLSDVCVVLCGRRLAAVRTVGLRAEAPSLEALQARLQERELALAQAHVREAELQRETRVLAARLAQLRMVRQFHRASRHLGRQERWGRASWPGTNSGRSRFRIQDPCRGGGPRDDDVSHASKFCSEVATQRR